MKTAGKRGFTLLEMSIVLVIVAVLVSAVMYAKTLVTTSRLQQVITDVDSYTSAVANFKQQYYALPGDFSGAGKIWGYVGVGSCTAGQTTTQGTGTQTCDGNGDGQVGSVSGQEFESFRFWQQLYNAGMLSQGVTGIHGGGGTYDSNPGTNVPKGPFKGSGYSVVWLGTRTGSDTNYFPGFYGNAIFFGTNSVQWSNLTYQANLSPDQAAAIDNKMDDGLPGTGKVRTFINGSSIVPLCSTTTSVSTATYNIGGVGLFTNFTTVCSLIFVMGF